MDKDQVTAEQARKNYKFFNHIFNFFEKQNPFASKDINNLAGISDNTQRLRIIIENNYNVVFLFSNYSLPGKITVLKNIVGDKSNLIVTKDNNIKVTLSTVMSKDLLNFLKEKHPESYQLLIEEEEEEKKNTSRALDNPISTQLAENIIFDQEYPSQEYPSIEIAAKVTPNTQDVPEKQLV